MTEFMQWKSTLLYTKTDVLSPMQPDKMQHNADLANERTTTGVQHKDASLQARIVRFVMTRVFITYAGILEQKKQ